MRDAVIDEITVKGTTQPPAVVVNLIRGFLQRLPLPRLLHFVDLVLPQMAGQVFNASMRLKEPHDSNFWSRCHALYQYISDETDLPLSGVFGGRQPFWL